MTLPYHLLRHLVAEAKFSVAIGEAKFERRRSRAESIARCGRGDQENKGEEEQVFHDVVRQEYIRRHPLPVQFVFLPSTS